MLGSNPSADSVASTDRLGGCFGLPFSIPSLQRPQHRERHQAINPGGRGQSPRSLRQPQNFFSKQGASHNACIGDLAATEVYGPVLSIRRGFPECLLNTRMESAPWSALRIRQWESGTFEFLEWSV